MNSETEALLLGLAEMLKARGWMCATAESCTGGLIGAALTSVSGSSEWYLGGVISYANSVKVGLLGVSEEDLAAQGAVSEPVVRSMAQGACRATGADISCAVSGVAGPGGGTPEKPVGTVWMAVATPTKTIAVMRNSGTDRSQIISRASAYAIEMLYNELKTL
jgi:PncC family amidohydrolase